jgi:hypothetical protein
MWQCHKGATKMILTNKTEYQNVKTSVIKEFRDKVSVYHSGGKKGFHPRAQAKISYSFAPMDAIVIDAEKRIEALDKDSQQAEIQAIWDEEHNVTVWEIDISLEWTVKNTPDQITKLREAKMIEAGPQDPAEQE